MSALLKIVWVDDENVDLVLDDQLVYELNHDDHGWDGMQAGIEIAHAVAAGLGADIVVVGHPNL